MMIIINIRYIQMHVTGIISSIYYSEYNIV